MRYQGIVSKSTLGALLAAGALALGGVGVASAQSTMGQGDSDQGLTTQQQAPGSTQDSAQGSTGQQGQTTQPSQGATGTTGEGQTDQAPSQGDNDQGTSGTSDDSEFGTPGEPKGEGSGQ